MFRYTVRCQFSSNDSTLVSRWLDWLIPKHIQDVMDCGATGGEVIKIDDELPTFAINYSFPDRSTFDRYEKEHAPGLREEGMQLFPHSLGLVYSRSTAEVVGTVGE